ncbi:MAG: HAMP domain-containing histidine kinase [Candidatus Sungbacteria bacterium]|nr:HAMP domain-containing histidine kinase [Candidatus Sungbacteria bacterium]
MDNEKKTQQEPLESLAGEGREKRANFPVFMKLVVVFLVFALLPFLITALTIAWSYDYGFRGILEQAPISEEDHQILLALLNALTHDLRIRIGFLFLIFGAFIAVGTNIASKIIVNPLLSFLKSMERLSGGDFETQIKHETSDEFSIFAEHFNRMAKQLGLAKNREQWVSQTKSQLISIAAHQLRTPLTVVQWVINKIREGAATRLTPPQQDLLEKGNVSVRRMTHLIDSLLRATAIEEGRFGYQFEVVDLAPLVEKSIEEARMLAETKNIVITLRSAASLPPVYIDKEKITIVLDNILANAIHYTPPRGTIVTSIEIKENREAPKSDKEKEYVEISIQDSGIGIPKKDIEKLFTRFFRTPEAASMYTEGAGLGLFITRNVILRHGGKIWAESELGKGSTFTFTLPSAEDHLSGREPSEQFFIG